MKQIFKNDDFEENYALSNERLKELVSK